jgi:hypothetical protein
MKLEATLSQSIQSNTIPLQENEKYIESMDFEP